MKKKVIIVGGGPGGYVAAIRAAQLGAEVHIIEKEKMGGTCLNVGCIPTKALLHTAKLYHAVQEEANNGLRVQGISLDWSALMARKDTIVNRLVQGVKGLLKAHGVKTHSGRAVLQDAHKVQVVGERTVTLDADIIVLASGSVPSKIPVPGANSAGVIDSTAALSLPKVPKSLIIVGGGVIGTEFASLYSSFGTKVTIVEMLPEILPMVDRQIAKRVKEKLTECSINFMLEAGLKEILPTSNQLSAVVQTAGKNYEVAGEYILMATGRKANVHNMGLEEVGIQTERGRIVVNEYFATNIPHIYAIGDCNGQMMLAHAASAQGVAAVEYALGHRPLYNPNVIPSCIYTIPEAAGVGLTEDEAAAQGISYKVGLFPLMANGKSLIEGCESGLIKLIVAEKSGEILGGHIFGPRATDLIGEIALAMNLEATVDEVIATIHAHPTMSEGIAEAALSVSGNAIHWPPGAKIL
ncbi:dihydrolipoyl dehydrogenase [Pelosinus propionicus]|uniref:Dihydrolipoyl dehydrogenase n=1 Tax=Pelosinus propionicus DSM 13327 TaxID=1123291 RepID=A0A1I4I2B0_9FIRM|nr:dihydrolipoyl dehydrogenase [Pelosinus propionicus]SFL48404.1 dihydrolipoamide dehydrogenase [Pelosinus propionicus DSM 13327]